MTAPRPEGRGLLLHRTAAGNLSLPDLRMPPQAETDSPAALNAILPATGGPVKPVKGPRDNPAGRRLRDAPYIPVLNDGVLRRV